MGNTCCLRISSFFLHNSLNWWMKKLISYTAGNQRLFPAEDISKGTAVRVSAWYLETFGGLNGRLLSVLKLSQSWHHSSVIAKVTQNNELVKVAVEQIFFTVKQVNSTLRGKYEFSCFHLFSYYSIQAFIRFNDPGVQSESIWRPCTFNICVLVGILYAEYNYWKLSRSKCFQYVMLCGVFLDKSMITQMLNCQQCIITKWN